MKRPVMFAAVFVVIAAAIAYAPNTYAMYYASEPGEMQTTATPSPTPLLVELEIAPTPVPAAVAAPTPTPTPVPEEITTPLQPFSVVWFSDTQRYTETYPEVFQSMMQWVADTRTLQNIALVLHTGDIVNSGATSSRQWKDAAAGFDLLGDLPMVAIAGNHDVGTSAVDYTNFERYIGSRYADTIQLFQRGRGSYATIENGETKLLFIGTGWGYSTASIHWLNEIIGSYADYDTVLCLHSYINENGELTDGGEMIMDKVILPNPNVKMVLCGHRDGSAIKEIEIDDDKDGVSDRTLRQMMYNYQDVSSTSRGFGALRILAFDPDTNTLKVQTYVPASDAFLREEGEEFTVYNIF